MLPHVLRLAIDTLEVTYTGELDPEKHGLLELAKSEAQSTNVPVPLALGGMEFFVQAQGLKGYAFRVENELLLIRVSLSDYRPLVWARLTAYGLALHGAEALLKRLESALADLGTLAESRLSRVDVACDVQGFDVSEEDMQHVVKKGRYRGFHEELDGWTHQFGRREVVVRIYNKTAHAKRFGTGYVEEPWQGILGFDGDKPVQRIEVQLRGAVLDELRLPTARSVFPRIAAVLQFGMEWAEFRVPGDDPNVSRWPVDPRWTHIKESCVPAKPLKRIRRTPRVEARDRALKRLLGCPVTLAAYDDTRDLVGVASSAVSELLTRIEEGELDFALLAEQKRCRLGVTHEEGVF